MKLEKNILCMSDTNTIIFIGINIVIILIFLVEIYLFTHSKNIFHDEKNAFKLFMFILVLIYSIQITSVSLLDINENVLKPKNSTSLLQFNSTLYDN